MDPVLPDPALPDPAPGTNTVTGSPGTRPAHAARPSTGRGVWLVAAGLILAGAAVAAGAVAISTDGAAPSAPASARSITATPTATPTATDTSVGQQ